MALWSKYFVKCGIHQETIVSEQLDVLTHFWDATVPATARELRSVAATEPPAISPDKPGES